MSAAAILPEPPAALELDRVTKEFVLGWRGQKLRVLDRLSLRVETGQMVGLLGPNGAGKSTALKLLLGLIEPTAGTARIFGVPSTRIEARRMAGYVPDEPCFPRQLTARELVAFHARLAGVDRNSIGDRVASVLDTVGLGCAADRRIDGYSRGMLQRVGLAQALVHEPKVLICDEPTAGMDPVGVAGWCEQMLALKAAGRTILFTSHSIPHVEAICDAVLILRRGRLVGDHRLARLDMGGPESRGVSRGRLDAVQSPLERLYLATVGGGEDDG